MSNTIKKRLELLEKQPKQPAKRKTLDDFYKELHLLDAFYPKGGKP